MSKYSPFHITGVLAAVLWAQNAAAADLLLSGEPMAEQELDLTLPAVSAPNGKFELYGGFTNPGNAAFRAAGSVSLPVGHSYGVQIDAAVQGSGAGFLYGGAMHGFTRDPDSYLLGLTGAVVRGPSGILGIVGVEGELYLDRVSLEGWAGIGGLNYDDPLLTDLTGIFVFADAAYYLTDDFRLSIGGTHLLGVNSLHLGAEYQVRDFQMPFSLTGDVRVAHTGAYSVMGGIKGYFGEPGKSLIDRHRQDDPPNRALSLFSASGSLLYAQAPVCTPTIEVGGYYGIIQGNGCFPSNPEQFCIDSGFAGWDSWAGLDGECYGGAT